jgi:hypothetical protein
MKRPLALSLPAAAAMIGLAALSAQKPPRLLVLEWAARASHEAAPVAILIEMGLKDQAPTAWSGHASVTGARVVRREGYRFRTGDRLVEPEAWEATSHLPIHEPSRSSGPRPEEGIAGVGIVLHLADLQPDAALTLNIKTKPSENRVVSLNEMLAGQIRSLWDGAVTVRRISAATPVVTARTEDDFPAAAYGPDGTLWLAYISYLVRDETCRIEQPELPEQPANFQSSMCRSLPISSSSSTTEMGSGARRCPSPGPGKIWFAARSAWRATEMPGWFTVPIAVAATIYTHAPSARTIASSDRKKGGSAGLAALWSPAGDWQSSVRGAGLKSIRYWPESSRLWNPTVAASPRGQVAYAYDAYQRGDFDVAVPTGQASAHSEVLTKPRIVAGTPRFEARPSLCYDPQGRLWIAYEEGPEKWGKDYGALDADDGYPLYNQRSVRVVCLQDGKLFRPAAELPTSTRQGHQPDEGTPRYAYPRLGIDGLGRVWLCYRQKGGTRYSTHPGSYWLSFARRLDGDHWTEPIEIHHSDGLLDSRPVLLPHAAGGLLVIHNTDGRFTTPDTIDNQIYMSYVDLPGEPAKPKLVPHDPGTKDEDLVEEAAEERAAVQRLRDYRIEAGSKTYRLLRGEFHRHTELSHDGGPDGSLEDMFRYAIDAAALDWIGNTDHDNGSGREYSWWLTQKLTDAYHIPNAFTPVFAYERSGSYPHGQRNCIFARRGIRTLPRLAEPDRKKRVAYVHADDTKMLYRYLRELDGICASHTCATGMGTDWRDNDPELEPVVEIYQGDRMSYEYQEAPRAGHDPKSGKRPVSIGGWQPAGFIDLAFKKGYRFGFESSSDHWSTHISYTVALAERHDRTAIVDALKKRHCYAATDNILADVCSGDHLMGDAFQASSVPALRIHLVGTKPLCFVDILKDSRVVASFQPGRQEYQTTWTDPKPESGMHYYYVRAQQEDGELVWSSPMWIDYTGGN